ncbi:MAG: hypothetical protein CMJ49_03010 [Planctomycetaceae bacterium]|nr:hypothetical protein [Planctomycetaceae bacterium]
MISGANPLCGNSHVSEEMSADMRSYFTDEGVVKYLLAVQAAGIDTLQARGDYHRVLHWLELFRREGGELKWIVQTASEMHDVFQNIRVIAAAGATAIYHHGTRTDHYWKTGEIEKVQDYIKCMKDCGVPAGLASHIPEVFDYVEDKGWDVDFYMTCFYNLSREHRESALVTGGAQSSEDHLFEPEDPARMVRFIQQTQKMCLAFKILGASRRCGTQDEVADAFAYAFAQIKPIDAVVVGMFPKYLDQIALNVGHTLAACRLSTADAS